ncbi:MAG TPA: TonB-dependent receptor [Bryobacteraceae bacterium]|nr:TonB-dependent receptor [Bryobacteraceae bacterium]
MNGSRHLWLWAGFLFLWTASVSGYQAANAVPSEKTLFEEMPVVEGAALHAQTLEEAPASVTIISANDIRKYGYRTLGEALASVRGVYVTYDRIYHYVGVAGFNIPGDYNTRFLVLLNGHPLTENIYNSNGFFGQDFGLDMDLVERIEFIRGPSSALYGSNGILATINIVTKSPVDQRRLRATMDAGSFGEKKVSLSTSVYLGKGANLLLSGSFFHNEGQDLYFPDFDSPDTNSGRANGVDGERGYHTFANLVWKDWSVTAYFNNREKHPPVPWGASVFPDTGGNVRDSRNFVAANYTRAIGAASQLRWQLSYDNYRYNDRFDYARLEDNGVDDIRTANWGDWLGSQLTYRVPLTAKIALTSGVQLDWELRNHQMGYRMSPEYEELSRVSKPDRSYALFEQLEWSLSHHWTASLGLRFDDSANFGHFLSPRTALVYQRSPKTVYKFVYGRPYRNPSTFERYYDDGGYSSQANPTLRPETAHTFEVSAERKLRHNLSALVDFYHYRVSNMIGVIQLPGAMQQYQNSGLDRSTGVEFELSGQLWRDLEATGSFALNSTRNITLQDELPNSPSHIGKLRISKSILKQKLTVASSTQYLGHRDTASGANTRPVLLEDITLTTRRLHPDFDIQFGIRNALNWRYQDPIYLAIDQMRQDGRAMFVRLIYRTRE